MRRSKDWLKKFKEIYLILGPSSKKWSTLQKDTPVPQLLTGGSPVSALHWFQTKSKTDTLCRFCTSQMETEFNDSK